MPQMQHDAAESSGLAADPGADQAQGEIGIFQPVPDIGFVEAVDAVDVGAPDRQVAGLHLAPVAGAAVAHQVAGQAEQLEGPVGGGQQGMAEPGGPARPAPAPRIPHHRLGVAPLDEAAGAGDEPARLGQPGMGGDEIGCHQAVAVDEDRVIAAGHQQGGIPGRRDPEAVIRLPGMQQGHRIGRPQAFDQGPGFDAGTVVGDDHLVAGAMAAAALVRQRFQYHRKHLRLVVCADDDGNLFRFLHPVIPPCPRCGVRIGSTAIPRMARMYKTRAAIASRRSGPGMA